MGAEDLETNRVQPGPKQGGCLVTHRAAQNREKGFLSQFLRLRHIFEPAPEKSEQWLPVAQEEQVEGIRLAARERDHQLLVSLFAERAIRARVRGFDVAKVLHVPVCLRRENGCAARILHAIFAPLLYNR